MKKGGGILLLLCALSLCMVIGIFIGRNLQDDYAVLPQGSEAVVSSNTEETTDYRLDINEATKTQLMDLPGIGEELAQRIINYRTAEGPFQTTDDLMNVAGIGQKKLQAIEELIRAGG